MEWMKGLREVSSLVEWKYVKVLRRQWDKEKIWEWMNALREMCEWVNRNGRRGN